MAHAQEAQVSVYQFTCAYFGLYVFAAAMIGGALGAAISPWMTWMNGRGKRDD